MQYVDISKLRLGKPFPALHLCCPNGGSEVTVEGNAPLSFEARRRELLSALVRYGLCQQNGTPTPSSPVDIVCNNGALRYSANMANVNEQTALVGYYINAQGSVLADSYNWMYRAFIPVKPNTTYTLSMSQPVYYVTISEYSTADNSGFIIRKTGTTGGNTSLTITTGANTNFIRFGTNVDRTVVTLEEVLGINWMLNLGGTAMPYQPYVEGGIYAGGTHPGKNLYNPASSWLTHMPTGFSGNSASWPNSAPDTVPNSITYFMRVKPNTTYTYSCATAGDRFGVAGKNSVVDPSSYDTSNKLVFDSVLVPLMGYSDVRYSFTTGANTQMIAVYCALNTAPTDIQIEEGATATAYEPYTEIPYLPEVLTVSGKNLFDIDTVGIAQGAIASTTGANSLSPNRVRTAGYVPVKPSTQYTISAVIDGYILSSSGGVFVLEYAGESADDYTGVNSGWRSPAGYTFTTGANTNFVRVVFGKTSNVAIVPEDVTNVQLEYGDTATAYEPYVTPQTANVEALLGVGTYKDTQEVVSGLIGRKMGVMVFDGTEDWRPSSSGGNIYILTSAVGVKLEAICTHFQKVSNAVSSANMPNGSFRGHPSNAVLYFKDEQAENVAAFKARLAAQYAAGTPVIVLYKLATPTTEQVAGQALYANKGTNTVDSTTNTPPAEMSITYID